MLAICITLYHHFLFLSCFSFSNTLSSFFLSFISLPPLSLVFMCFDSHFPCPTPLYYVNQNDQHVFVQGQNKSIGAFFRFAKATTDEERAFRLRVLEDNHLKADKVGAFLEYWELHADNASGESAIE